MTILRLLLVLALLAAGWCADQAGLFFNALIVLLMVMVPVRIGELIVRAIRRTIETRFLRRPFAPEFRTHLWQVVTRWIFGLATAILIEVCVAPVQMSPADYASLRFQVWGMTATLMIGELWPAKQVRLLPLNLVFVAGSLFIAVQMAAIYFPRGARDAVVLSPPFRGEWIVLQGGRSHLINHHYPVPSQRDALDLVRVVGDRELNGDPQQLESYPSWSSSLLAPAAGRVVAAVGDLPDNAVGQTDEAHLAGNHLVLDLGTGNFVLLAHLKRNSLLVRVGDKVEVGQPIAQCGNSGNTSAPHLHLQVQNGPDLFAPGTVTHPITFRELHTLRAGQRVDAVVPRRNDRLVAE
ncbi:MAG: M23 family metallopeptidase [Opitutaceae bacterium]